MLRLHHQGIIKSKKRKWDDEEPSELHHPPSIEDSFLNVPPECVLKPVASHFVSALFDMSKFKGAPETTHHPIEFSTDGLKLSMTYMTIGKSCKDWMSLRGMQIPDCKPQDMSLRDPTLPLMESRPFCIRRGMYQLCGKRNDLIDIAQEVTVVAIDPGKIKPIQVGEIDVGPHTVPVGDR